MNVLVFDTETAGCKTQTLLNVGYKIVDLHPQVFTTKTLVQRDYIVRSVINNELFMLNDMFVGADKLTQLKANIEKGGATVRTIQQIFGQLAADIARYKVSAGYAYNADFDTDKFARTAAEYGIENPLDGLPIFDLWGMAYEFICNTDEYKEFCKTHEMLTDSKRFYKTSVEGVSAFLLDKPDFVEEHTALSDVQWETNILVECLKRGANPFKAYKHGFLPSGYVFEKTIVVGKNPPINLKYTKMSQKWDSSDTLYFTEAEGN